MRAMRCVVTYVEEAELGADVEDAAGGGCPAEQRQERLGEHLGPVEVGPEHRLRVLHRVAVDLVERHPRVVHLRGSETQQHPKSIRFRITQDCLYDSTRIQNFRYRLRMAYLGYSESWAEFQIQNLPTPSALH